MIGAQGFTVGPLEDETPGGFRLLNVYDLIEPRIIAEKARRRAKIFRRLRPIEFYCPPSDGQFSQ